MDVAAGANDERVADGSEFCAVSSCTLKATDRYNQQAFCSGHLQERLAREY